ncbi:hypothetical protein OsI_30258 [Oryza sativa Indica Group]|uniref:Uncharacterized protein n=1 Tax=Oryza sativa subsp. indica TaxID=39946 RepID=A2YY35_ORYSI|nr:hypothetical protein OsI_30258 [Oryza sativa Indica Group]
MNGNKQSLIYSFVAKGSVVLAEHTAFSGNFSTIAVQCLQKLPPNTSKSTYSCDGHTFNFLVDRGFVFLVVADEAVGRSVPFVFLDRVKEDFMQRYGSSIDEEGQHPLADDADDDDFLLEDRFSIAYNLDREFGPRLKDHMLYCINHPEEISKLSKVKAHLTEVKGIMMDNIEKILERGEKIELLVGKTETLQSQADSFHRHGRELRRKMWLQNLRFKLMFEHFSLKQRSEPQIQAFRDVVQRCELHDLGFSGVPYTYDNRREGRGNVKVCLDRALADDGWRGLFSTAQVFHLSSPRSDHCPIPVKFYSEDLRRNFAKCVHYEIYWERDPAISEVIAESWGISGAKQDLSDTNQALFRMMSNLRTWSKKKFRNVSREIEKTRKKLSELLLSNTDSMEIRRVSDQMNELLYREEMIWLQRSRIAWLKEGDRNTRFFHSKAVWRAKKNKITKLRDSDGTVHSTTKELESMATEYFQRLFTADPSIDHSRVTSLIKPKVTDAMNEELCKTVSEEEIANALFQIGPLKAPGPDGFPGRFYQRNWAILKDDIVRAVQEFFSSGTMPSGVNETAIVLIPKTEQPQELKDFRPISLCNVVYKIVSKCLVNRLRPILDDLVSQNQRAFVPGRLITNNAVIAF